MTPTFETVLTQAKNLPPTEREKLIESLKQISEKNILENRREKIRAFRGKFRRILPSVEEFLIEKSLEFMSKVPDVEPEEHDRLD